MSRVNLPAPEAELAACVWLPRIIAKARALKAGTLTEEYAVRFGAPDGVDGFFLNFFGLKKEQIQQAAELSDAAVAEWFRALPGVTAQRIAEWNHTAVNLGRPGFPFAERLPLALKTKYRNVADRGVQTIFEMLGADEE
jgi:hypothetical protein